MTNHTCKEILAVLHRSDQVVMKNEALQRLIQTYE